MSSQTHRIVILTAGAGGMYCGSCLQDNSLAAALHRSGVDIQLLPTYTPIRTDEIDHSQNLVLFGGINVYLQQKLPLIGKLPPFLTRWLDHPRIIRWATSRGMETNAAMLGELTLSMLKGKRGNQRAEVDRLVRWLRKHGRPNLVQFSNVLIAGCARTIKQELDIPIVVTLQGDDFFLSGLPTAARLAALNEIKTIDESVDGYVVHSRFYADHMASFLGIDRAKFHQVPLAIDSRDFRELNSPSVEKLDQPTIGYLARLAPEKGLHVLVEAFENLRTRIETSESRLLIAGWLGPDHKSYADELFQRLRESCGANSFEFRGAVTRSEKLALLAEVDVLSVPTTFLEPKGLYVLESLAAGVPVVQPDHGAFPELIESTRGGLLFKPNDSNHLADQLAHLFSDRALRQELSSAGRNNVQARHTVEVAATELRKVYEKLLV